MIAHTSLMAYALLRERLTRVQFATYKHVDAHPGLTGGEIERAMSATHRKRLSDLEKLGVVRQGPERACSITNQKCVTWYVIPDAVPRKRVRTKPPKPSEILAFVEEVERVHAVVAASNGLGLGLSATKVLAWLRERAAS
jgi:hypothetical protein